MAQTDGPRPPLAAEHPEPHDFGPLSLVLLEGDLRRVTYHGVEVLRRLSCPIRDASWGTLAVEATASTLTPRADGFDYRRSFRTVDGSCSGTLSVTAKVTADSAEISAQVTLQPLRADAARSDSDIRGRVALTVAVVSPAPDAAIALECDGVVSAPCDA